MSIKRSPFEKVVITSNDQSARTVDITSGCVQIDYYEDVFSPIITAKIRVVNTGNVIIGKDSKNNNPQGLYTGLPLRGGEKVEIKIAGNSLRNLGLDLSSDPKSHLYVSSISDAIISTNKESFTLNLAPREAITNETTRVGKKYELPIHETVNKISTDILKASKIGTIDKTSNKYSFIGTLKKPFSVLTWLASKSVPEKSKSGTAGFFFYQTIDGFQFRSIDLLNEQTKKETFIFSETAESYDSENKKVDNDLKILNYSIERNQNLLEKMRLGTYSNTRYFFNPLNATITEPSKRIFRYSDYANNISNLGKEIIDFPDILNSSGQTLSTRIVTGILDVGTLNKGISKDVNADLTEYQSQVLMRYNNLTMQILKVTLPLNTNLRAGDIIECLFPRVSRETAKEFDEDQSGLYMIKELRHHFNATNSFTALKLVRDTFGRK